MLLLVARPLSVFFSLVLVPPAVAQQLFISWAGLRGAVPIVLATFPLTAGVPGAALDLQHRLRAGRRLHAACRAGRCRWVARRLGIAAPLTPREVRVESAPLEELDADLLQMTVPAGSRLHGVYLPELRLPEDAAVVLIVRDGRSFVPDEGTRLMRGDQALLVAARGARAGGRAAAARGQPGRPAGQLARREPVPPPNTDVSR